MLPRSVVPSFDRIQGRLLSLAALFVILYALALTFSPAVRARSWQVELRWEHWLGVLAWLVVYALAHFQSVRWLPERDPFLLPIAALLSGWGLLSIWRLLPTFGVRQSLWLCFSVGLLILGFRLPSDLGFLRRYKYLWLTSSLLLMAITLLLGTNPMGFGPRMWLGFRGVYFQPSEPLKLLLIAYLAAYLADRRPFLAISGLATPGGARAAAAPLLPLLAPTMLMTSLALILLVIQRDLGAAFIFLFLYAAMVYVTSGRRRVLVAAGLGLLLASVTGYLLFDVVQVRVDAWLNPWGDPSGRSYQIVQSLLALANGGLMGRGPGLGSPGLVPLAHSDFIYTAIAEEAGLIGTVVLLLVIALLVSRGLRAALFAADAYRRYLAAGLTVLLAGQSLLIIGGNLRLLPLTGVTLPFVSYGGSSLVTSFIALLLLLHISNFDEREPVRLLKPHPYRQIGGVLFIGLAAAALATGWWAVVRAPELLARTDNPRRGINDLYVRRGSVLGRDLDPINVSFGEPGGYVRKTLYPDLSNVVGYTDPVYGQSGLETSLDDYLRGLEGNSVQANWWSHLLYGHPPPGVDVRLSLNLSIQRVADEMFNGHSGAVVLVDARSGEILAMASHPTFDANQLEGQWDSLVVDPEAPLFNRAAQGLYSPGAALGPFLLAQTASLGPLPSLTQERSISLDGRWMDCAVKPPEGTWPAVVASGCPAPVAILGQALGGQAVQNLYHSLGLFTPPVLQLPVANVAPPETLPNAPEAAIGKDLQVSPLQMALAAATLSTGGVRPAPHLVIGMDKPQAGWTTVPALGKPALTSFTPAADAAANQLSLGGESVWESTAFGPHEGSQTVTWYLGGTLPGNDPPLAIAIVVEDADANLVREIGRAVLQTAIGIFNPQ